MIAIAKLTKLTNFYCDLNTTYHTVIHYTIKTDEIRDSNKLPDIVDIVHVNTIIVIVEELLRVHTTNILLQKPFKLNV